MALVLQASKGHTRRVRFLCRSVKMKDASCAILLASGRLFAVMRVQRNAADGYPEVNRAKQNIDGARQHVLLEKLGACHSHVNFIGLLPVNDQRSEAEEEEKTR